MIVETKEVYKCGHCRKLYQKKSACAVHEVRCGRNPENFRACFGCVHLDKIEVTQYYDTFQGEQTGKVSVMICKKLDEYLHPPIVEHRGNAEEFGDRLNEPMPKECEHRKTHVEVYFENR